MTEAIIALVALTLMEIVLGIDNIVFISILTGKLPIAQQSIGRRVGLLLALATRLLLLGGIFWIAQLTSPLLTITHWLPVEGLKSYFYDQPQRLHHGREASHADVEKGDSEDSAVPASPPRFDQEAWEEFNEVSWRDLILLSGGLFLIYNSVREIHHEMEGNSQQPGGIPKQVKLSSVLIQIAIMDIIFSLDSVITAVGMANQLWVMFTAVIIAVGVMILFADQVGRFVERNATVRMLALNFLLLIGVMLVAEGIGTPINKGYIYFAMGFSLVVEFFNIRIRAKASATLEE